MQHYWDKNFLKKMINYYFILFSLVHYVIITNITFIQVYFYLYFYFYLYLYLCLYFCFFIKKKDNNFIPILALCYLNFNCFVVGYLRMRNCLLAFCSFSGYFGWTIGSSWYCWSCFHFLSIHHFLRISLLIPHHSRHLLKNYSPPHHHMPILHHLNHLSHLSHLNHYLLSESYKEDIMFYMITKIISISDEKNDHSEEVSELPRRWANLPWCWARIWRKSCNTQEFMGCRMWRVSRDYMAFSFGILRRVFLNVMILLLPSFIRKLKLEY